MFTGIKRKQFNTIFFVELWERWAFYGFQSLFMLFITYRHLDEKQAYLIFGIFAALLYITPTIGGYIADKYLGIKRSLMLGGIELLLGYILLSLSTDLNTTIIALSFIIVGNGFFKPTPSALISKIFDDPSNSDSAFTLYYMAVNIGSFLGIAITPLVAKYTTFSLSFLVSVVGMFVALSNFLWKRKLLHDVNGEKDKEPLCVKTLSFSIILSVIEIFACYFLFQISDISFYLIIGLCLITVFYMIFDAYKIEKKTERVLQIIGVFLVIEAVIYFVVYNQMFSTLTLFAKHNLNLYLLGMPVTPATFSALDALWLILLSPVFAALYQYLNKTKIKLDIPLKYASGTIISGLAFIILFLVVKTTENNGMISGNWMIIYYLFAATAELLIAALGFSLISLYFRDKIVTFGMGFFMLALAAGGAISGKLGELVAMPDASVSASKSLPVYAQYFIWVGIICILLGLAYFIFAIIIRKWAKSHNLVLD